MAKHNVHFTKFAFCRKHGQRGGLFNQNPLKAAKDLVPRKKDLPTEYYGGYQNATASFYMLAKYHDGKKYEVMFVPIELLYASKVLADENYAKAYVEEQIVKIYGKPISSLSFPLGMRRIRINAMLSLDGFIVCLTSKKSGGKQVGLMPMMPLALPHVWETYVKHLEEFCKKCEDNPNYYYSEPHDKVSTEKNIALYDMLLSKLQTTIYSKRPALQIEKFVTGREGFAFLGIKDQCECMLRVISTFGKSGEGSNVKSVDIGSGTCRLSSKLSNFNYCDVRIIDTTASGLFFSTSQNLKDLL